MGNESKNAAFQVSIFLKTERQMQHYAPMSQPCSVLGAFSEQTEPKTEHLAPQTQKCSVSGAVSIKSDPQTGNGRPIFYSTINPEALAPGFINDIIRRREYICYKLFSLNKLEKYNYAIYHVLNELN